MDLGIDTDSEREGKIMDQLKLLLGAVLSFSMRIVSIYLILNNAQIILLRSKNSNTTIRKIKKRSKRWEIITSLCFWNADCAKPYILKFLIVIRVIAVVTAPVTLLFTLPACICTALIPLWIDVFLLNSWFEVFICVVIGTYTMFLYGAYKKRKKK